MTNDVEDEGDEDAVETAAGGDAQTKSKKKRKKKKKPAGTEYLMCNYEFVDCL